MSKALQHLGDIKKNDEWETPPFIYAQGLALSGIKPIIDVCATEKNKKCMYCITKEQDVLKQKILSDWYCNPAYSLVKKIVPHLISQSEENSVNGLMLIYSKTDTTWWHDYIENNPIVDYRFIRGRVPFYKDGKEYFYVDKKTGKLVKGVAPYPSAWIIVKGRKE